MNFLIDLYTLLNAEMVEPTGFGSFHFICVGVIALLTLITCKAFKNCSDDSVRRITAFVWLVILILEIYKNLIFGFEMLAVI